VGEAAEHLPERLDVVGVGGDAGDEIGHSMRRGLLAVAAASCCARRHRRGSRCPR
jgi:hypothetical protein